MKRVPIKFFNYIKLTTFSYFIDAHRCGSRYTLPCMRPNRLEYIAFDATFDLSTSLSMPLPTLQSLHTIATSTCVLLLASFMNLSICLLITCMGSPSNLKLGYPPRYSITFLHTTSDLHPLHTIPALSYQCWFYCHA
jgi:hypothetical protein